MNSHRTTIPLLLGAALLAVACGGQPTTPVAVTPGSTTTEQTNVNAVAPLPPLDLGDEADGPLAPPGLGKNPASLIAAAPPPDAAAIQTNVPFVDAADRLFIDPVSADAKATRQFFKGRWIVNGGYLEQGQGARSSSLSIRQYNGDGFGSNGGTAPAHYRTDVTVWVYQPSAQYPNMVGAPLGILGFAPYYVDETHYLLAVAKPTMVEVWAVDGNPPGTAWPMKNRLFQMDLETPLDVGTPVAWSVEVNTHEGYAFVWLNGKKIAQVEHKLLSNRGNQHVALISNGNFLHFQDFKVYGF